MLIAQYVYKDEALDQALLILKEEQQGLIDNLLF